MGSKASRNTSIEALRLVAVAGIAIFHTFQWTFQAVCTGLPEYAPLAVFPYSGALGFINLLGCWANEVFFMISGYFLIPSAVRALQNGSSAPDLARKSLARLKKIVLPTLFYCAACLLISMYVYPLPEISLHEIGWLTLGIEFIWVYAASVLLVPVIALIRQRIGSIRAPFVVALLVLATFGINCSIVTTQRLGRSPSGSAMKAKKQCRATTAAGIVKKSRNENTAPVAIDQRTRRLVKARAFGADPKRRLIQDIMMSATKNEMHRSRSPIKLKNRLVENNRITTKPNVNSFENRFRKAT